MIDPNRLVEQRLRDLVNEFDLDTVKKALEKVSLEEEEFETISIRDYMDKIYYGYSRNKG